MSIGISYWDRGSWIEYLRNDVLQLYGSALTILNLWRDLRENVHGKLLSDAVKERGIPTLELIFVAGTSPPDNYGDNSLALIYKKLLGTSINLREYYFLKRLNREPRTKCNVERTILVDYIDHISALLERVLTHANNLGMIGGRDIQAVIEASKNDAKEILEKPETFPEKLVDFLNRALRITIAYNEHTRFIWYLRKIPKKYIKELYPEMLKPEVFKFIQEFLGLREYIVPLVEDPEIADLYTIYSYDYAINYSAGTIDRVPVNVSRVGEYLYADLPDPPSKYEPYNTIGGCMCRVNVLIWRLFTNYRARDLLKLVTIDEVPSPYGDWVKLVGEAVKDAPYYMKLNYPRSYEDLSRLDEVLPAVFVGKYELMLDEENKLWIIRIF